ncbi:MAG: glycosyltransferase [Flavobacteriales bacterium]|nr:glycosyltransferase [Flavobacteriales bacterium]
MKTASDLHPDATSTSGARSPRSILVLTYWGFNDALVQTYTLPYLRIIRNQLPLGSVIHLVTLEKTTTGTRDVEPGIRVHAFRYVPFGWKAMGMMLNLIFRCCSLVREQGIDTVHAWCTPAGMVGYMVSVLTGRRLILDSYEPHAEAMVENGTWARGSMAFRILFLFERLQSRRAQVHIAAAEGMRHYALEKYGADCPRFFVKPACVDLERFSWKNRKRSEVLDRLGLSQELVAVYAGKFGGIYLDREVFSFLRVAREHWGERLHVVLLTAHSAADLEPFMRAEGLEASMFTILFVDHKEVPDLMGVADFALTPVRPVPTKRYCTPIKDGEYWALGLPVVITPDISDDSLIIARSNAGVVLEGLEREHFQQAVKRLDVLLAEGAGMLYGRIRPLAEKYRDIERAVGIYRSIYGNNE